MNRTVEYKVLNYPKIGLNNLTWVYNIEPVCFVMYITYADYLRFTSIIYGQGTSYTVAQKKIKKNQVVVRL